MGLYEKSPHDLVERQAGAAKTLTECLSTPLNGHTLATMIDLLRLSMNETAILSLLRKIRAEHPFTPKEASYLVTWLADHGDRAFLVAHRDEIETVKKELDGLSTTPKHEKLTAAGSRTLEHDDQKPERTKAGCHNDHPPL